MEVFAPQYSAASCTNVAINGGFYASNGAKRMLAVLLPWLEVVATRIENTYPYYDEQE